MSEPFTSAADVRNRRGLLRRAARGRVECRTNSMGLGPNIAETLLDISQSGARVLLRAPVMIGKELEVQLLGCGETRSLKVVAQVVWVAAVENGRYVAGFQFNKAITYADLNRLGGEGIR